MTFNYKAFATGFMEDQARQINTRVAEAREYKRELKENAEESKGKINQLKQLQGLAKSEISRLRALGFNDKHINAAIASGPKGLFDLSTSAQAEAKRRDFTPGQKFDQYEIDSLIDYSDNFMYGDVRSEDFYEMNTALSKPSLGSTKDPKRGVMKTLFGIDLDDAVRSRLDKDAYYDGYSVMDINEISKQEAYESVAPGTYFSFLPTEDFDGTSASRSFMNMLSAIDRNIADKQKAGDYVAQAQQEGVEVGEQNERARELAALDRSQSIFNQVQVIVAENPTYLDKMGSVLEGYLTEGQLGRLTYEGLQGDDLERKVVKKLLTNTSAKKDIENIFTIPNTGGYKYEIVVGADGAVKSIISNGTPIKEDMIDEALADLAIKGLIPSAKIVSDPKLPEGGGVDKTEEPEVEEATYYKDDSGNIASGVPPRPERSFSTTVFGGGMSGEDRDDILAGRMRIPDNLRPNQWDELFGDTHDPETGKKLDVERLTSDEEPSIVRLDSYDTQEEKDKAFDAIPIGGKFYDDDGTGPHTKRRERGS
tara:strand:- start:4912 stop:6522 length:1611 start_codon:yes stop_codon:yes gene_type:complete